MRQLTFIFTLLFISMPALAVKGKIDKLYLYSYIEGMQVYWQQGAEHPTNCSQPNLMTLRSGDKNGEAMMSMLMTAYAAEYVVNCTPKEGCTGINGQAEINYCLITRE